ncbi:unnamed protein product [Larinioides sclopetarius]|uniref:Uncharacterized protein n=1 Tax=Larinioides sclopetarius TaxID=280406 RepID=A0AAV2B645_9ARAC
MKHSKSYCLSWVVASITILFLDKSHQSSAQDGNTSKLTEYFRSVRPTTGYFYETDTVHSNGRQQNKIIIQEGITVPFCSMFGCGMGATEPPNCDTGYKWDTGFNRCRQIL